METDLLSPEEALKRKRQRQKLFLSSTVFCSLRVNAIVSIYLSIMVPSITLEFLIIDAVADQSGFRLPWLTGLSHTSSLLGVLLHYPPPARPRPPGCLEMDTAGVFIEPEHKRALFPNHELGAGGVHQSHADLRSAAFQTPSRSWWWPRQVGPSVFALSGLQKDRKEACCHHR